MKRNNAIPNNHFKKTALRYKTWFNQPAQAARRKSVRIAKAKRLSPMPVEKLRPVVRCPTIRYNRKVRLGRGFTPEECEAAGFDHFFARSIGISVDFRRRNSNSESFNANVERLREYRSKVTIFSSKKEAFEAGAKQHVGPIMPVFNRAPLVDAIKPSEVSSYE